MELTNKTNNYTMYKDKLSTGEEFRIVLSNTINSSIEINVKFNENFAIIEPNKCYISIMNISDDKVKDIIMQTWKDIQRNLGIKNFEAEIKVIVNSNEELTKANKIAISSGLRIIIEKSAEFQKQEQEILQLEQFLKANTITKLDNGSMKTFTVRKADPHNAGYILEGITCEEMYRKLQEIKQDPSKQELYKNNSEEQLANAVLDIIALEGNRRKYYLESAREQVATSAMGNVAGNVAYHNEGTVNKETGVIQNGPSKTNEFNTVEVNDDKVKVVTPEVNNATVGKTTTSSTSYSFNHQSTNDYYNHSDNIEPDKHNNPEYNISQEENKKRETKDEVYTKKRKLSPNAHKSSGVISLPIIIFILSGLLLVASAIIFLMSK